MVLLCPVRRWWTGGLFDGFFEIHSSFAGTMPRQQLNGSRDETRQVEQCLVLQSRESKVRAEGLDIVVAQRPMMKKEVVELEKRYYM